MTYNPSVQDPHANAEIHTAGEPVETANAGVVLLHGRGASAESILGLADHIGGPGIAFIAPQAADSTWYPLSFLEPMERNEPWLTSALACVGRVRATLAEHMPFEKIAIGGFSQGGCLSLEYVLRNPRRYGAVFGLSAGIIGPPGTVWNAQGSVEGTTVFLGCSDIDSHIPLGRVHESKAAFERIDANVIERIYPGMGHMINQDEIALCRQLVQSMSET